MMSGFRNLAITCVLGFSAAAAIWLIRDPGLSSPVPGQVVARDFKIAAVETGRLATVLVAPGQRVTGGQVIARLDTSVLEREIAAGEARLRQLDSETQASTMVLEVQGYETERSFQTDAENARADLETARANYAQQSAELKQVREDYERQTQYLKEGLVRRDRLDELEVRLKTLERGVSEWPARLEGLASRQQAAGGRVSDWRSKYSGNSAARAKEARVQPVRQRAAEQIEALRVLRVRLENAKIVAPADGDIISVLAQPGDVVRAGDPFVILTGLGARQVIAYVSEREGRVLQAGRSASLHRRTLTRERFPSRVIRVADTISPFPPRFWPSPQIAVYGREVVLDVPSGALLDPGEALDVTFAAGGRT
jgi:multidrug resistance efflux pump